MPSTEYKKEAILEKAAIILLLAIIVFLLWKIAYKRPIMISSQRNEWIALVAQKIKAAGKAENASYDYDYEAPIKIEFVPIICWDCSNNTPIPITPSFYGVWNRLNDDFTYQDGKYETKCFWLRDGIDFNIDNGFNTAYNNHSFWEDIFEYASSGKVFDINGNIPGCYRKRFAELDNIRSQADHK